MARRISILREELRKAGFAGPLSGAGVTAATLEAKLEELGRPVPARARSRISVRGLQAQSGGRTAGLSRLGGLGRGLLRGSLPLFFGFEALNRVGRSSGLDDDALAERAVLGERLAVGSQVALQGLRTEQLAGDLEFAGDISRDLSQLGAAFQENAREELLDVISGSEAQLSAAAVHPERTLAEVMIARGLI